MKRAKKVLCLVLAVVLTLSLMSVGVFAASDSSTASVTDTGLIASLIEKLFGNSTGTSSSGSDNDALDIASKSDFVHGIVEVALDHILNDVGSGNTNKHGIVTVNTGDLFKDIASHSDYTHGIVTVDGNTTTINFGKLFTDLKSSDAATSTSAKDTLLAIFEKLGLSADQSKSTLAELVSGKLTDEGLASLVSALGSANLLTDSGIAQMLAALNNSGFIKASDITARLQSLLNSGDDTKDNLADIISGLISASTLDKTTLAGVVESLMNNSTLSKSLLTDAIKDVVDNNASVVKNVNDNLTNDLTTLIKNGITGSSLASVISTALNDGTWTKSQVISALENLASNGTINQKLFKELLTGLLNKGFSGDDVTGIIKALIAKGTVTNAGLAQALSDLVSGGLVDKGKVIDLLSKLLPSTSSSDTNPLFKLFMTLAGTTAADIQAKLLKLLKSGSASDILTYLKSLFGNGTPSTLLAKLEALLKAGGLPTLDITKIINNLKSLLGLGGSDTDITDDDTPLAGGLVLNDVDHNAYVSGRTSNTFVPGGSLTRAEAAQMLYGLLTEDSKALYAGSTSTFSDVNSGAWYYNAVCTLAAGGVLSGYPNGTFKPNSPITRAEFATVMTQFYGLTSGTNKFVDVSASAWYYEYVVTAAANGWVTGYPDGTFKPQNNINRAEAVTVLNSVLGRSCDLSYAASHASSLKTFVDVTSGRWFYAAVTEAANGHNYTKSSAGAETWTGLK